MELKGYIVKIFVTKKMEKNLVVKPNLNTGHKKKKKEKKMINQLHSKKL